MLLKLVQELKSIQRQLERHAAALAQLEERFLAAQEGSQKQMQANRLRFLELEEALGEAEAHLSSEKQTGAELAELQQKCRSSFSSDVGFELSRLSREALVLAS